MIAVMIVMVVLVVLVVLADLLLFFEIINEEKSHKYVTRI